MSRFIFYSGLAHCVAFVGVVGYMTTRPKESLPDFLQSKNVPHVEVTTRETVETDVVSGNSARHNVAEDDSTRELRDRKIRANLPAPPETPRVVDKVKDARKLPTTLPAKKGASHIHQQEAPAPETGRDIPLEANQESEVAVAAAPTQESQSDEDRIANEIAASVADEAVSENETPAEDDEKLQIAAFDVDELAESHLQKLKAQEEREHLERMEKLKGEKEAALMAVAAEKEAAAQAGTGDPQNESASEGTPSGTEIRALSELRQAPGNKTPQYDVEDRRQGRQGLVVFLAYIKADGLPKEFQLQASSGHRSLDAKTLKALKGWKFQPGQEGWVEIPFQWDLKGGAQEAPSHLRRQGSR